MSESKDKIPIKEYHKGGLSPLSKAPTKYKNASITDLLIDKKIVNSALEWAKTPCTFLIFMGRAGCGKTYLSHALAQYIWILKADRSEFTEYDYIRNDKGAVISDKCSDKIKEKQINFVHPYVELVNMADFYAHFKKLYQKGMGDLEAKDYYKKVDFLFLDDLGATANTPWQVETAFEILDYRYSNLLPTMITSNLDFDTIESTFHQRMRSRLEDKWNKILFDWETDYRRP